MRASAVLLAITLVACVPKTVIPSNAGPIPHSSTTAEYAPKKSLRVGYILPDKKRRMLAPLEAALRARGFAAVLEEVDLADPASFEWDGDVLLSHTKHLLGDEAGHAAKQLEALARLEAGLRTRGVPLVDSLEVQKLLTRRLPLARALAGGFSRVPDCAAPLERGRPCEGAR